MPAAKKRSSPDGDSSTGGTTRASKAQKTSAAGGKKASRSGGAGAKKQQQPAAMPTAEFKTKARPLHVHVTHTPPSINAHSSSEEAKAGAEDVVASVTEGEENLGEPTAPSAPTDVGMISSLTLLPSEFSTGSYGWKGSKKVWVELQGAEGTVEKVQVMLTINATVVGSKGGKKGAKEGAVDEDLEEGDAESEEKA